MKKWFMRLGIGILVLVLLAVGGFVIWGSNPLGPMPEAEAAMQSGDGVLASDDGWLVFKPVHGDLQTGLIYYPGARVDPVSYAPMARSLAEEGFLVVITPMPINFAFLNPNEAADVIAAYPQISSWVVGGHSLGGAMAAEYLADHPEQFDGFILFASFSAENTNLSQLDLPMLSIYGSEDGSVEEIRKSAGRLPESVIMYEIKGGNHAQFGWYGLQSGDGEARISREEQQQIIIEQVLQFLLNIES